MSQLPFAGVTMGPKISLLFAAIGALWILGCDCQPTPQNKDAATDGASLLDGGADGGADSGIPIDGGADAAPDASSQMDVQIQDTSGDTAVREDAASDAQPADVDLDVAVEDAAAEDATIEDASIKDAPREDASEDSGAAVDAWFPEDAGYRANYVFVTSTQHQPGELADLTTADNICQQRASSAGLFGHYVAWLSTENVAAAQRLGEARGWQRTDGLPVADRRGDLLAGRLYYPPAITELGTQLPAGTQVVTGTSPNGELFSGENCQNWTSLPATAAAGIATATTDLWTLSSYLSCEDPVHLYCFGTDLHYQIAPTAVTNRLAFVSTGTYSPGTPVSTADAICATEATAAGLTGGPYYALLGQTGTAASARYRSGGWSRVDGISLANTSADFFSGPGAPLNVTAMGDYVGNHAVWTGSANLTAVSQPVDNCSNWVSTTGSLQAFYGIAGQSGTPSYNSGRASCAGTALRVYCLAY